MNAVNKHDGAKNEKLDVKVKISSDKFGRLFMGKNPILIITREFMALLQQTAEKFFGARGAALFLYNAGFKGGYNLAKSLGSRGLKGPAIMEACLHIGFIRGWGVFGLVEFDVEKPKVDVIIRHSPAEELRDAGRPACHLWRGIIAGVLQYIAESSRKRRGNVKIVGREVRCIARGDPYCEIIAEPAESPGVVAVESGGASAPARSAARTSSRWFL